MDNKGIEITMATIKSYTDLEQSRKLTEILSPESADLCYLKREINDTFIETPIIKPKGEVLKSLPCWSLAALLSVLPRPSLHQTRGGKWYCDAEPNRLYFSEHFDNPIDACYEMILKLHELNLL